MSDILEKSHFGISQGSARTFHVRWTNLQPPGVTFPQNSELLKSFHV